MIRKTISDFNIEHIAKSGQCFRIFNLERDVWKILAKGKTLIIQKVTDKNYIFDCTNEEFENVWTGYFDLQTDYSLFKNKIYSTNDKYLIDAIDFGWGIRILRQDFWETTISFIISQRNNIPRITKTIERLCEPFGGTFPSPDDLKNYSGQDFEKLGLGYRSRYLKNIVKSALDGQFSDIGLYDLHTNEVLRYLQKFDGIGSKVASCIALFSLHKIDAFPVDVWVNRIISERYSGSFPLDKFNGFEGIVQQYMFFYERSVSSPKIAKKLFDGICNC